jgi:response regulator receiver domain-containing protein
MPKQPLIAIVDDDKSIRNGTRALFKAAGFWTATFEDAESFLASANRATAACLVADMRLPGMTGLEFRSHRTSFSSVYAKRSRNRRPDLYQSLKRAIRCDSVENAAHNHGVPRRNVRTSGTRLRFAP